MPIEELVERMLLRILEILHLTSGNRVGVIINNLGSVSTLEMGIICHTVAESLGKFDIDPFFFFN